MPNFNKIWFYSAALAVVIAGVYFTRPSEAEQQKMQAALAKKRAERAARQHQHSAASAPVSAPQNAAPTR